MTSEPRAWERPDGSLIVRRTAGTNRVDWLGETMPTPTEAVPLHPIPEVTEDESLRRSRTEVRADAFREAADLVDVLTTSWRNTGGRDSANATAEVSKLLRNLARMEEAKDV